jgi:hypothetical protein
MRPGCSAAFAAGEVKWQPDALQGSAYLDSFSSPTHRIEAIQAMPPRVRSGSWAGSRPPGLETRRLVSGHFGPRAPLPSKHAHNSPS